MLASAESMTEKNSVLARFCKHDKRFRSNPFRNLFCSICHVSFQDIVILSKDPQSAYLFSRDVKGADISSLEKVIINSRNLVWVLDFARWIEGADIKALEKIVINSKDPYWAYFLSPWSKEQIRRHWRR